MRFRLQPPQRLSPGARHDRALDNPVQDRAADGGPARKEEMIRRSPRELDCVPLWGPKACVGRAPDRAPGAAPQVHPLNGQCARTLGRAGWQICVAEVTANANTIDLDGRAAVAALGGSDLRPLRNGLPSSGPANQQIGGDSVAPSGRSCGSALGTADEPTA